MAACTVARATRRRNATLRCFRNRTKPIRVRIMRPSTREANKPGDARAKMTALCRTAEIQLPDTNPIFAMTTTAVVLKDLASLRATENVVVATDLTARRMSVTGAVRVGGTDRIGHHRLRHTRTCARDEMVRSPPLKPRCAR